MVEAPPFDVDALTSAISLVRRSTSDETATIFERLIRMRGRTLKRSVDLADVADRGTIEVQWRAIEAANSEFASAFQIRLTNRIPDAFDEETEPGPTLDQPGRVRLSATLVDLLDRPFDIIVAGDAPDPDFSTASWIAIVVACLKSGAGHHIVLRCLDSGPRELTDAARLVATRGAEVRLDHGSGENAGLAVLRAELHGGAAPVLVVMNRELVTASEKDDEYDSWDRPAVASKTVNQLSSSEADRLGRLQQIRNTYVWRASADLVIDTKLAAFVGGAIGPMVPTRAWREDVVGRLAPGLGDVGIRALAARVSDPRDLGALGATVRVAAAALSIDPDEAAVFVAGSLSGARPTMLEVPSDFDARLVVCDEEGQLLLARARELAKHGARVLLWGPPGGGKSTFAQALAVAMGRGVQTVTGASILARSWGVTERIIADLWSRAADDGSTLVIDEIDSLCGVRDPGASGGNAYLVRTLTNEFLRAFDAHSVPIIATANHLDAIDEAVRRRFVFVINVCGELTPEAERLAWQSVLNVDPPPGWVAIGANVSDFANAARRCRMLGLLDSGSFAAAIERSRDARLGPRLRADQVKRSLQ